MWLGHRFRDDPAKPAQPIAEPCRQRYATRWFYQSPMAQADKLRCQILLSAKCLEGFHYHQWSDEYSQNSIRKELKPQPYWARPNGCFDQNRNFYFLQTAHSWQLCTHITHNFQPKLETSVNFPISLRLHRAATTGPNLQYHLM